MSDRDAQNYAPFDDARDYDPDAGPETEPRRGGLIAAIAFGILLIFSAVLWHAYRQGVRDRDAPPQVAAPAGPYKVAPEDAGGLQAPEQDLELNNQFDGGAQQPAPPAQALQSGSEDALAQPDPAAMQPALRARQEAAAAPVAPLASAPPTPRSGGAQMQPQDTQPRAAPAMQAPKPEITTGAGSPVRASAAGRFVVQVAAVRAPGEADAEWTKLARRAPDLFASVQKDVERADLGAKGVFYRVRAAAFADRSGAAAFCEQVKTIGQDCIVVAR